MSKRLQVLLDEEEYKEIQGVARRHRVTLAEWVRQPYARQEATTLELWMPSCALSLMLAA